MGASEGWVGVRFCYIKENDYLCTAKSKEGATVLPLLY